MTCMDVDISCTSSIGSQRSAVGVPVCRSLVLESRRSELCRTEIGVKELLLKLV